MTRLPNDNEIRSQLAPVRARVLASARAEHMMVALPLPGRRRRLLAVGIAASAAVALTAGAIGVANAYSDAATTAWCYEAPDLSSRSVQVVDTRASQFIGVADRLTEMSPIELCAEPWESGELSRSAHASATTTVTATREMPALVACAKSTRLALVFPLREGLTPEELCGTLGLAAWDSDSGV